MAGLDDWAQLAVRLLRAWSTVAPGELPAPIAVATSPQTLAELERRQIDSLYYIPCEPDHPTQRVYDNVWAAQKSCLEELLQALEHACRQTPIILKGAEIVRTAFGGHGVHMMNDIDLFVRRDDLESVKRVAYTLGYVHGTVDPASGQYATRDIRDIAEVERTHYELAPFNKPCPLDLDAAELDAAHRLASHPIRVVDGQVVVIPEFDFHFQLAADVTGDDCVARAIPSAFERGKTLCDADALWFLISRYYTEVALHGKTSLRDMAYIGRFLQRASIDWRVFVDTVVEFDMRPAVYYFLWFADSLGPGTVPSWVYEALDVRRGLRTRDWGWQVHKLLGTASPPPRLL